MIRLTRSERQRARAYRRMIKHARARTKAPPPRPPPDAPVRWRGRLVDRAHKQAVAQLFCLATYVRTGREVGGVHVAHVRASSASAGAPNPGLQRKPDDCWTVPLSPLEHRRQHAVGERAYWSELGLDPHQVARALFEVSPDLDAMRQALRAACSGALAPPSQAMRS